MFARSHLDATLSDDADRYRGLAALTTSAGMEMAVVLMLVENFWRASTGYWCAV
jgi:hypothetical protein